ncbi:MAG: hypothetical protein LBE74_01325 [Treponema sp.]|jgi:hypothetical protein|nr:hypothetical protein [Treponema sp.]
MSIFSSLPDVLSRVKGTIQTVFSRTSSVKRSVGRPIGEFFRKYRNVLQLGAGVIALFLLTLVTVSLISVESAKKRRLPISVEENKPSFVPSEDIFLMDEPDFLPDALLEKQPKKWDAQDVRPFWTNPLENGAFQWEDNIKNTVDEIMEKTP